MPWIRPTAKSPPDLISRGRNSHYELKDNVIAMTTESDFQLSQMLDILYSKLAKRGIDLACVEADEPVIMAKTATAQCHDQGRH